MIENVPDISREGVTLLKGVHFLKVLFSRKTTEVLGAYNSFSEIDFEQLKLSGKKGIILDIDECVALHHGEVLPDNFEIIKSLVVSGFKIVIFSNMKKSNRYTELENIGIKVVTSKYAKPDKRGFIECLGALGLGSNEVVMIGDNYLTDGGSKNAGIDFIKIRPINTYESKRSFSRKTQLVLREIVDNIATNVHKTLIYN